MSVGGGQSPEQWQEAPLVLQSAGAVFLYLVYMWNHWAPEEGHYLPQAN